MKYFTSPTLLLVIVLLLLACNPPNVPIEIKIESIVKESIPFPNSFKFIDLTILDTTYQSANFDYRYSYFQKLVERSKALVEVQEKYREATSSMFDEVVYNKEVMEMNKYQSAMACLDTMAIKSYSKLSGHNEIASILIQYDCRVASSKGVLKKTSYFVQVDSVMDSIIMVTTDKSKLQPTPNIFPEYMSVVYPLINSYGDHDDPKYITF